jgi:hypothetical protein
METDTKSEPKRVYTKPALHTYGDVREFTRGGKSGKEAKAAGSKG